MDFNQNYETTAQFVMRDYQESYEREEGMMGYKLDKYKVLAERLDGIKPGLISFPAKANIGKSVFITTLAWDLLVANPDIRVVFITLDDVKRDILNMLVSHISGVNRNKCNRGLKYYEKINYQIEQTHKIIAQVANAGRFNLLDIEDLKKLGDDSNSDYCNVGDLGKLDHLMYNYTQTKETVFVIDSPAKVRTGYDDKKHNDTIADFFLHAANRYNCPIIVSNEIPKSAFRRPTHNDIKGSANWAYNLKVAICLSVINEDYSETGASPVVMFDFSKNKFSGYKGKMLAVFSTGVCDFKFVLDEDERRAYFNKMKESDREYNAMYGGR